MEQLDHQRTNWNKRRFPLIIACDNWETPQNVGMAFRLADAFGAEAIWLGGCTPAPPNRKLSKTARSTERFVPFEQKKNLVESLKEALQEGWHICSLEITDSSVSLFEIDFAQHERLILVGGSEKNGIQEEILAIVQESVHIPMYGQNSSLNVATALAIALGEYVRQH